MDMGSIVAIFIASIGALASWASHRASTKATSKNNSENNRVEMEKEAYERARKLDTETISRQDDELADILAKNAALVQDNETLRAEVRRLEERVRHLEEKVRSIGQEQYNEEHGTP